MNILVVGDWQNAIVTWACLGHLGHFAILAPRNGTPEGTIPKLEIPEPGLDDMIQAGQQGPYLAVEIEGTDEVCEDSGRLRVGYGLRAGADRYLQCEPDMAWLATDTPASADVSGLLKQAERLRGVKILVVSSQVPIGTCDRLSEIVQAPVVYVPENMRLGNGINTFLHSARLVVGGDHVQARTRVLEVLAGVDGERVVADLKTSEFIKHATNAWLAMNISFANELSALGEPYGVDMKKVTSALRADDRIGKKAPLMAGDGYGGTLARDAGVLSRMPGATLMRAVQDVNEARSQSRNLAIWKKERGQ